MRDIMVPVAKDAMFHCDASSLPSESPPSLPKWKKNGVDLVIDGGKIIFLSFCIKEGFMMLNFFCQCVVNSPLTVLLFIISICNSVLLKF